MNNKKLTLPTLMVLSLTTVLAGCASQAPAPVVEGYWKATKADTRQALHQAPNVVEEYENYAPKGTQALYHVVQSGDTMWRISQKYDTDVATLKRLNNIGTKPLYIGQRLVVAEATDPAVTATQGYSLTRDVTKKDTTHLVPIETKPAPVETKTVEATPDVSYELYRVRSGENLFRIGLKYHVSALDIMAANDMAKPEDLQAGAVIKVPVVSKEATPTGTTAERTINEALARQEGFIWPTKGKVISTFGRQGDGVVNNGIKIKVKESTPIYAAEDGVVIYADSGLKTYGNLILLRHSNGLITAYAHNSQNMATRGEKVQKGEVIALAGMTGNVTEPQLHFEVRRSARAIDPLKILPNTRNF